MAVRVNLSAIELDTSIQCRATIDTSVVNEYAERMSAGDAFPPIDLFGTWKKCWIGDGWHRVLAAKQIAAGAITANLREGGRAEALNAALGANATHGHRRSNADKRRSVEVALREFPTLSSRAIARLCGVGPDLVLEMKPGQVSENDTCSTKRTTGRDGKRYPARRQPNVSTSVSPAAAHDPSQHGPAVDDIPDKEESELVSSHLAELKRHWKSASRADRRIFVQWIARKNTNQSNQEQP
jgi:hypothetical protein